MSRVLAVVLVVVGLVSPAFGQKKIREVPSKATLECGADIPWKQTVAEALAEAKAARRPVFWYVPTLDGSRMDRKREIDLYMMTGPFAAEEIAVLLQRKFIAVKAVAEGDEQQRYGLKPLDFVEPGFLVLAPDGEEILRLHEITTFNTDWIVWQIRRAFTKRKDLDLPSNAEIEAAGDAHRIAMARFEEGDLEGALAALGEPSESEGAEARYLRARSLARLRRHDEARKLLAGLSEAGGPITGLAAVEAARLRLRENRPADAAAAFEAAAPHAGERRHEARFLHGAALRLSAKDGDAARLWKELAVATPADRWTRKAAAEAQRLGPFSRCFERFDAMPDDAFVDAPDGTRLPRGEGKAAWVRQRSVDLLLSTQKADGSWDDSNYDFGGTDSLPNVYVAGTALAALALHECRDLDPTRIDAAVDRALAFLADEKHLANDDVDEIAWAHAYRLLLLEARIRGKSGDLAAARKKAIEIVKRIQDAQLKTGGFRHEYPNPFVTASVLHVLARVKEAGIPVAKDAMEKAAVLVEKSRGANGTYSYGFGRNGGAAPEFSVGRSPICELALLLTGKSSQEKLQSAIELAFEHHPVLERVRKVDDHADRFGNGGFFFWYGVHGRRVAIDAVTDPAKRKDYREKLREQILAITEIDGGFVDSHELGKTYGTAMGLLCLQGTEEGKE